MEKQKMNLNNYKVKSMRLNGLLNQQLYYFVEKNHSVLTLNERMEERVRKGYNNYIGITDIPLPYIPPIPLRYQSMSSRILGRGYNFTTSIWYKKYPYNNSKKGGFTTDEMVKEMEKCFGVLSGYYNEDTFFLDIISTKHNCKKMGVGKGLLESMISEYPNHKIVVSELTKNGEKFFNKMKDKYGIKFSVLNGKYEEFSDLVNKEVWIPIDIEHKKEMRKLNEENGVIYKDDGNVDWEKSQGMTIMG